MELSGTQKARSRRGVAGCEFGHEKTRHGAVCRSQCACSRQRPAGGRRQNVREVVLIVGHISYLGSLESVVNRLNSEMRNFIDIVENAQGGLEAMLAKRDDFTADYEDDGYESEEDAAYAFDELYDLFEKLPDPMPVYRGMAVTRQWLQSVINGDNPELGVHWTYDEDAARSDLAGHSHPMYRSPENRQRMTEVVICGTVPKNAVEWDWTFSKNMGYGDEAEVHIVDTMVYVLEIITPDGVVKVERQMPTGHLDLGGGVSSP